MTRFEQIEQRINEKRPATERSPEPRGPSDALMRSQKKDLIVSVRKLQRIEDTFGTQQILDESTANQNMSV